ncbi:major facilitator superfamily domain-containing protein [Lanmaoa asiatica]|nr:major facilitator superfamily domain-containing protein [Lanmaoa asiatica]
MSAGKDVSFSEGDQTSGPRNISVNAYETNLKATAHKLNEKESLSAWLTILASGFGLISDGYQNNLMTMSNVVFKALYPTVYTSAVSTQVSNALLVGAIIGQIFVGLICDRMGRKVALVSTTLLIVLGATLGTAAHGANGSALGLFWFLTVARGITGVGVGGEYPASSTSASEAANEKSVQDRGPSTAHLLPIFPLDFSFAVFIMVTNFVLSFGGPLAVSVFLIVLSAAGEQHLQTVWRVCFGFGILLPLTVLVFRLRMLSSKLYRKGAIKRRVPYWLVVRRYWRPLIGTCGAWFLYDFVTFPNGVFSGTIISSVIHNNDIKKTAEWQLLLGTIALPGVFVGAWLCNRIGRRNTMMLGFSGYLVFGLIIGLSYNKITTIIPLFVVFYGLMQSFGNMVRSIQTSVYVLMRVQGPGDMLGLTSSDGTCYGLSAAIGKTGAAIGTQAFTPIQNNLGKRWTFIIAAICGVTGVLVTYFFVPDMTGVDLAEEDAKFLRYLTDNGWEGEIGEDDDKGLIVASSLGVVLVHCVVRARCLVAPELTTRCPLFLPLLAGSKIPKFPPLPVRHKQQPGVTLTMQSRIPEIPWIRPGLIVTLHPSEQLTWSQPWTTSNDVNQRGFSRPDSSRYAVEYTNLLETLCRSFSKDQLRRFTELYKLDPIWTRSSRRKTEYAESIIEKAWSWPSLKEIERKRRDMTEVLVKWMSSPRSCIHVSRKDGADLLQLSMQYNVHISLTSNPLALRVEGLRGSLKALTEHISSLKKGIIDEIFELPTGRPVRPDLLQRISRLAGAYVENHGNRGKVRICAKDLSDITAAERLALRASLEIGTQGCTVCYDPPSKTMDSPIEISEPHRYSIYPFVTPCSFPWTMHSGGAFRLRRVADWLGVDSHEDITSTGGLAHNPHRLVNLNQCVCYIEVTGIADCALEVERSSANSLGHILISSGDNSQRATIFPPLKGTLSLPDILKWVENSGAPLTFVPRSVPPNMMTVTVGKRRVLHRLIYRTLPQIADQISKLPQHVLKFEMELAGLSSTSARAAQDLENAPKFKDTPSSEESNPSADPLSSQGSVSQPGSLPEALNNGWDSSCQVGRETYINLMLPDRPMDLQLCIFDGDGITLMQYPSVLRQYADKLRDFLTTKAQLLQPDPPSTFNYEGKVYYLHDNLSLRQSNNPILTSTVSSDCHADNLVKVCSESILDLQSTQKIELCQVKYDGIIDQGPSWKRFLQACDQLSVVSLDSRGKKDKPQMAYLE